MTPLLQYLIAAPIVETVVMIVAFGFFKKTKMIGVIDIFWSLSFFVQTILATAILKPSAERVIVILLMVGIWSLRLTVHLTMRFMKSDKDDPRYDQLRSVWLKDFDFKVFLMFLLQGVSVLLLMGPVVCFTLEAKPLSIFFTASAVVLFATALLGESIADAQLEEFKKRKTECVCKTGLWKYSRHPNYFFEWLVWCAFFVLCIPCEMGAFMIYAPLIMLVLLTKVTGIPPAERLSLEHRGAAFARYQETTSAFFPWFPKERS
jgi:steroid 5-alpha reductase family enzyme